MTDRLRFQTVISSAANVAWYDMFEVLDVPDSLSALAAGLEPGEFVACDVADIPQSLWEQHRAVYAGGGHGLKLEDIPTIVGVVCNDAGNTGLLIGYRAEQ